VVVPGSRRSFLGGVLGTAALTLGGCGQGQKPEDTPTGDRSGSETANQKPVKRFAPTLRFGVATSAYQIEGGVDLDGRSPSIWDTYSARPGTIDDGSSGAIACDHYHRWAADVELMAELGMQTYRFSVAWPRVMPAGTGRVNQKGLDFYRRLVDRLRQRDITPVVTLYHWDLPQVLQDRGGWVNRDSTDWFADYAATVFDQLDGVERWLTINEARVIALQGHLLGVMAPGIKDPEATGAVLHHLGLAHGRAVQAFRASRRDGSIGPCITLSPCYPATDSDDARAAARAGDLWANALYLEPVLRGRYPVLPKGVQPIVMAALDGAVRDGDLEVISSPVDFLGVNYYSPTIFDDHGKSIARYPTSAADWQQIYPDGLYDVLLRLHRQYGMELMITENGIPDTGGDAGTKDGGRIEFMHASLLALHRALEAGARVSSYHAWSLLDNFEWARGYTERWGLVHVDYDTQRRTPKESATWYTTVARQHALPTR